MAYIFFMKSGSLFLVLPLLFSLTMAGPALARQKGGPPNLRVYEGKWFTGSQDPDYHAYDLVLREYLVHRIRQRYGIELDPKTYSGFDLLEIEALLKFKKSHEPIEPFLKLFPRHT